MDFLTAGAKFRELKARFQAGQLTEEQFKSGLQDLMVQDSSGQWWIIGYETERWYRHDGSNWIQADPPGLSPDESNPSLTPWGKNRMSRAPDRQASMPPASPPTSSAKPASFPAPGPAQNASPQNYVAAGVARGSAPSPSAVVPPAVISQGGPHAEGTPRKRSPLLIAGIVVFLTCSILSACWFTLGVLSNWGTSYGY